MNLAELLKIKFPEIDNFVTGPITLHDHGDGNGTQIGRWEILNIPKPDAKTLSEWFSDPNIIATYQKNLIVETRKTIYPPIEDQLDMLYHDLCDNTSKWTTLITNIKEANPFPASVEDSPK